MYASTGEKMANYCTTTIKIMHDDMDALNTLKKNIVKWVSSEDWRKDKGLDLLVQNSGIKSASGFACDGYITAMKEPVDGILEITTDTKWIPMMQLWQAIVDKYLPDAALLYTASEPGFCIFETNDSSYVGKYNVSVIGEGGEEALQKVGLEECEDVEEKVLVGALQHWCKSAETDVAILMDEFYDTEYGNMIAIDQWEFFDIANQK